MNYEITEEQIKELAENNAKVKEWFPEVFETKLEVGKWYKDKTTKKGIGLIFVKEYKGWDFGLTAYGFDWCNGDFIDEKGGFCINSKQDLRLATDSEVEESLINEAKKIGFVKGAYINGLGIFSGLPSGLDVFGCKGFYYYDSEFNTMYINRDEASNIVIFEKGKWAEIVKTYTKEEAEKLLKAKII